MKKGFKGEGERQKRLSKGARRESFHVIMRLKKVWIKNNKNGLKKSSKKNVDNY